LTKSTLSQVYAQKGPDARKDFGFESRRTSRTLRLKSEVLTPHDPLHSLRSNGCPVFFSVNLFRPQVLIHILRQYLLHPFRRRFREVKINDCMGNLMRQNTCADIFDGNIYRPALV